MKKIITALTLLLASTSFAQMSCCSKPNSTDAFTMLTNNKKFIASHEEPEPFVLELPLGKDINYKTADGKEAHAYFITSDKPSNKYVFVIHEWWGLNDYIKQESDKIYKALGDVNVIALDLYDKKVATTRDSASKYTQAVKTDRAEAIIKGAIKYAGSNAQIATIGWCFGGGWSMQATLLAGKQSKACVMYYGMPEEKTDKLKTLNAPVLLIWAEQDQWINEKVVSTFKTNMSELHKTLEVKPYNADHAFANPSNPKYSKDFAEDAHKAAMAFIFKYLK